MCDVSFKATELYVILYAVCSELENILLFPSIIGLVVKDTLSLFNSSLFCLMTSILQYLSSSLILYFSPLFCIFCLGQVFTWQKKGREKIIHLNPDIGAFTIWEEDLVYRTFNFFPKTWINSLQCAGCPAFFLQFSRSHLMKKCIRHIPTLCTAMATAQGYDITFSSVVHGVMCPFISCIMEVSSTGHGKSSMFYLMALPPPTL